MFQFGSSGLCLLLGVQAISHSFTAIEATGSSIERVSVSTEWFFLPHTAAPFLPLDYYADQLCVHPHSLLLLTAGSII